MCVLACAHIHIYAQEKNGRDGLEFGFGVSVVVSSGSQEAGWPLVTSGFRVQEQKEDTPSSPSTAPWGLCLCVCNPSAMYLLLGIWGNFCLCASVSVGPSICVAVTVRPCRPRRKKHSRLWQVPGFMLCISWVLCHGIKRSLGRILASLWNQSWKDLGNMLAQEHRNGGNRMRITGGQRSYGEGERARSQKF